MISETTKSVNISSKSTIAALFMLAVMGVLMFSSIKNDAIIIDEDPHIGAGYSYLKAGDFRLNPEHPPLMKDLGALPLLGMSLVAPWDHKSWKDDINGQWEFGRALIFNGGNNADAITQAAKVPMILFTLVLGFILFAWTKKEFGAKTALLATFFYTFSPTFLAHGRFVATDVGASAGFFIATIAFLAFLKNQSGINVWLAGFALGFAFLVKFSTFMLLPIFFILTLAWYIVHKTSAAKKQLFPDSSQHAHMAFSSWYKEHSADHVEPPKEMGHVPFWPFLFNFIAIVLIAYLTIYPLYWHHTRNYPAERQKSDTTALLSTYYVRPLQKLSAFMTEKEILPQYAPVVYEFPRNIVIWASDKPLLKPYAEYFLGLLMVFQRAAGGNTTYFLGEVAKYGSRWYFPMVYALKEPLTVHILSLVVLIFALTHWKRPNFRREWFRDHFVEIAFLFVTAFYWWASMRSILNIGVRHILPTFAFIYIVVAVGVVRLYAFLNLANKLKPAPSEAKPISANSAPKEVSQISITTNPYSLEALQTSVETKIVQTISAASATTATPTAVTLKSSVNRKSSIVNPFFLWGFRLVLVILLLWQVVSVSRIHPFYLAYFNEIAGGPKAGAEYVVDSNLDWGQDLKRVAQFVEANNIQEIYFDYFGWADPYYYLGEKRKWLSSCDEQKKGWVAVSASFYQGSREKPECDYRRWLPLEKRVADIGHSIYIWHIE